MATIKRSDKYGSSWEADLGDDGLNSELSTQLRITGEELGRAIMQENVSDKLFARILKNRQLDHKRLLDQVPGATGE